MIPLTPRVSVAIPIFNEQSIVPELIRRTLAVLDDLPGGPHELVFVDDGSTDQTPKQLAAAAREDSRINIIRFSRNFGHQAAIGAALDYVTGDVVVLMDGDLQDAPEYIPEFVSEFLLGNDVVFAERTARKENIVKRSCYRLFYWIMSRMSDPPMPENSGDFGLMSRRVVNILKGSPERHRFWRGLRSWVGFSQSRVLVERHSRHSGEPKFTVRKLFRLALNGMFSFSVLPIRAAAGCGAVALLGSSLFAAYAVLAKIFLDQSPAGFTSLTVGMVFLSGVQLLFLGIVGEYIGRIYEQVKQRPHYIVDQITSTTWTQNTHNSTDDSTPNTGGGVPASSTLWPESANMSAPLEATSST